MVMDKDVEKGHPVDSDDFKLTYARTPYRLYVTPFDEIYAHQYRGEGTLEKPYVVDWLPNDSENPQTWGQPYKWLLTVFVSMATLAVSFCSSAYVGVVQGLFEDFGASTEVVTLGISCFVLGFAVGKFFSRLFCSNF
jgi:Ca2+/H+ antiporter